MSTNKPKQKVTLSSPVFLWIAFAFGVLAILMMFVPCLSIGAKPYSAANMFFECEGGSGVWPTFIGYMLIAVGSLICAIVALPFFEPSRKLEIRLLVIAGICFLVGIILVMLIKVFYCSLNDKMAVIGTYHLMAGTYLTASFSIISLACTAYAIKLDF